MGIISFICVLFLSYFVLYLRRTKTDISLKWLWIGWTVKLGFAVSFILIFTYYYGNGVLFGDTANFINDSQLIHQFGVEHPFEYVQLLVGLEDEKWFELDPYLRETQIWSYGENGDFLNDNRLIIRLNSLFHFISFGNPYVHLLLMAFLSFWGILLIYKTFYKWISNPKFFYFCLIGFPSVGFWGSGISKESLFIFGLGLFFYGIMTLFAKRSLFNFVILSVGVFVLFVNKPYAGLVVVSLSLIYCLGKLSNWSTMFRRIAPFLVLSGLIGFTFIPTPFNLLDKISYKQKDLINMGQGGIFFITDSTFCAMDYRYLDHFTTTETHVVVQKPTKGEYKLFGESTFYPFEIQPSANQYERYLIQPPSSSFIPLTPIENNRSNLLLVTPEALINTLLRPFPTDVGGILKYLAFFSNLLLISFITFALIKRKPLNEEQKYWVTYLLLTAFVILLFIGWTTPIVGAIVRYKIAAEILLIIVFSIVLKPLKYAD